MANQCLSSSSSSGHDSTQIPDEHLRKMVTEVFTSVVLEYTNLDVQLLGTMLTAGVLTKNEVEEISNEKKRKSNEAALRCLLSILENHPQERVYSKFFHCLEESENKSNRAIAQYILGDGLSPNIKEKFCNFYEKFEKVFGELVAVIHPSEILDFINSHLSVDDREAIIAEENQSGKSRSALLLLLLLSRSTSDWPIDFVEACEKNNLRGAAELREALDKDTASSEKYINHNHESERFLCQTMDTDVMHFSEEYMDMQEPGDMEIREPEEIEPVSAKETAETFVVNSGKQEDSQTESSDRNSLGCISKYRIALDQVGQVLTKDDSVRLARLLELSNSEVDSIERHQSPSHEALGILEKTGKFSENNMTPLFDALKELTLLKAAALVRGYISPQSERLTHPGGEENTSAEAKCKPKGDQRDKAGPSKEGEETRDTNCSLTDDQKKLAGPSKECKEDTDSKLTFGDDQPKEVDSAEQCGENRKPKFTLRDDQRKVAEPGKQGKNYIILAETGFGKTLVAADIIKDHLKDKTETCQKKVAFVVEKKSLADQQEHKINEFLGKQKEVVVRKVTGYDATVNLPIVLETCDVLVATAGVIHNEFKQLNDGSLTVFSLVIFDECHHCLKGHPFNQVMRMYHKEKRELKSLGKSLESLPQIIGMTATLGTGQAKSEDNAVDHALNVMANLDTDFIQTVEKNEESDSGKIGSAQKDTTHIIVDIREEDPFKDKVISLMSKVEEKLSHLPGVSLLKDSPPYVKDSQQYEQWVISNKDKHCPEQVTDEIECRNLLACLEYLLIYHKALCINREVRSKDAFNFIKKFVDKQLSSQSQSGNYTDLEWDLLKEHSKQAKDLQTCGTKENFENPLLKELEHLFVKEYTGNANSLGLLFTATIEGTRYLKSWIEETPKLHTFLKTECVTRETTQSQHEEIRKKFDNHIYNLLIVTSVADEGWDIADLNLVFCLNYLASDYTAVQRPGRLRAKGGKYYVIGYGNLKKSAECSAIWKKMMETAVKNIKDMNPEIKKKKLNMFQAHDERLCEEVERRQELKKCSKNRREYTLHCKKCQVEACSSYSIKRFKRSQHYIASQEFCDNKMLYKPHPDPQKIVDGIDKIGKLHCKNCDSDWGIINSYAGQLFPVIKIVSFTCRDSEVPQKRKALKKWSDVPFDIDDVDSIEENLFIDTSS